MGKSDRVNTRSEQGWFKMRRWCKRDVIMIVQSVGLIPPKPDLKQSA